MNQYIDNRANFRIACLGLLASLAVAICVIAATNWQSDGYSTFSPPVYHIAGDNGSDYGNG